MLAILVAPLVASPTLAPPAVLRPVAQEAAFPELHLTLTLPDLEGFEEERRSATEGTWSGRLGESEIEVGLVVFEEADFWLEPGDVTDHVVDFLRQKGSFQVNDSAHLQGEYGHASYASLVAGVIPAEGGQPEGTQYLLGGLLDGSGYLVYVECRPEPEASGASLVEAFLEDGIAYDGPVRDPDWTDEEVLERWRRDAPDQLHEDFEKALDRPRDRKKIVIRTDHYLILTNASSGKFYKKLEEYYDEISEVYPFPSVKGQRLMPIFLFRTAGEYYDYCGKVAGMPRGEAENTKGHAWRDYYATWYEAPNDPVHIHEMTHQIFDNRLHLGGGGSWFQEGVAEYIETSENDRNNVARLVRNGEHVPLREFVGLSSLVSSEADVRGRGGAGDAYKQAALLIEFLCESKFGKGQFERFLKTMGKLPYNDVEAIDAGFQAIYGRDLEGVEAEWKKYCKKR